MWQMVFCMLNNIYEIINNFEYYVCAKESDNINYDIEFSNLSCKGLKNAMKTINAPY